MEKKTDRYLCIHGHFYQPPRENPWTDTIFIQKSAHPYHDWNERITRECYAPNTRSRLNGENGYISKLINNFELISFNFGPTLLKWLEKYKPWVYTQIINADRLSADRFNGHGNALAQVYNHLIMPLAPERDKITQVKWGLADFYHRFNRKAEGMWLAETAVDSRTLAILAKEGVKFTILSPYQAHLTKSLDPAMGDSAWLDASGGKIDCSRPYRCFPSDNKNLFIDLFFYNGPLSKAIAYEKVLASGELFLKKIKDTYPSGQKVPALVSMATDGESYGHHFKFGEMALTWVLETINSSNEISLTNYAEFLDKFPPENEVKIVENSAWSCAHGVERWRSNCGCSVSQNPAWTQSWRAPLRNGLNWLNEHLSSIFVEKTKGLLKDCWKTRDDYIQLLLRPDDPERETFLQKHALKSLSEKEKNLILQLLDSQQMALYMFTSCGWFFDDIAGIEAVQILMYAKKAIELCKDFSADDLEKGLEGFLSEAVCNDREFKNGLDVYKGKVVPMAFNALSFLANYSLACVIDENRVPEWLRALIKPDTEEIIDNGDNRICICEVTDQIQGRDSKSELIAVGLKTLKNELACIIGDRNEYTKEMLLKDLKSSVTLKGEADSIIKISEKHINNGINFKVKDLIPDINRLIVNMLTDEIENSAFERFMDDTAPVKNYLELISATQEAIPDQLTDLLKSVFLNQLVNLLKSSESTPLDISSVDNFLELFNPESDGAAQDNNNVFILNNIVNQNKISILIEEFLSGQIKQIQGNNINLYLNNIVKIIKFITKYKMMIDWWQCQNRFNDFRVDRNFIDRLDNESLSLFRQVEHLLGFTGGI